MQAHKVQHGEAAAGAKLTEAEVREIRAGHAAGNMTFPQLATKYAVSRTQIVRIVRRRSWQHVE